MTAVATPPALATATTSSGASSPRRGASQLSTDSRDSAGSDAPNSSSSASASASAPAPTSASDAAPAAAAAAAAPPHGRAWRDLLPPEVRRGGTKGRAPPPALPSLRVALDRTRGGPTAAAAPAAPTGSATGTGSAPGAGGAWRDELAKPAPAASASGSGSGAAAAAAAGGGATAPLPGAAAGAPPVGVLLNPQGGALFPARSTPASSGGASPNPAAAGAAAAPPAAELPPVLFAPVLPSLGAAAPKPGSGMMGLLGNRPPGAPAPANPLFAKVPPAVGGAPAVPAAAAATEGGGAAAGPAADDAGDTTSPHASSGDKADDAAEARARFQAAAAERQAARAAETAEAELEQAGTSGDASAAAAAAATTPAAAQQQEKVQFQPPSWDRGDVLRSKTDLAAAMQAAAGAAAPAAAAPAAPPAAAAGGPPSRVFDIAYVPPPSGDDTDSGNDSDASFGSVGSATQRLPQRCVVVSQASDLVNHVLMEPGVAGRTRAGADADQQGAEKAARKTVRAAQRAAERRQRRAAGGLAGGKPGHHRRHVRVPRQAGRDWSSSDDDSTGQLVHLHRRPSGELTSSPQITQRRAASTRAATGGGDFATDMFAPQAAAVAAATGGLADSGSSDYTTVTMTDSDSESDRDRPMMMGGGPGSLTGSATLAALQPITEAHGEDTAAASGAILEESDEDGDIADVLPSLNGAADDSRDDAAGAGFDSDDSGLSDFSVGDVDLALDPAARSSRFVPLSNSGSTDGSSDNSGLFPAGAMRQQQQQHKQQPHASLLEERDEEEVAALQAGGSGPIAANEGGPGPLANSLPAGAPSASSASAAAAAAAPLQRGVSSEDIAVGAALAAAATARHAENGNSDDDDHDDDDGREA